VGNTEKTDVHTRPITDLFGTRQGKTAMIICSGPSLSGYESVIGELDKRIKPEIFVCNHWRDLRKKLGVKFEPEFVFYIDPGWDRMAVKHLRQHNTAHWVLRCGRMVPSDRIHYHSVSDERMSWRYFTGDLMLNVAMLAGYDAVFVFGWTCSALTEESVFHEHYFGGNGWHGDGNWPDRKRGVPVKMAAFLNSFEPEQRLRQLFIFEGTGHPYAVDFKECYPWGKSRGVMDVGCLVADQRIEFLIKLLSLQGWDVRLHEILAGDELVSSSGAICSVYLSSGGPFECLTLMKRLQINSKSLVGVCDCLRKTVTVSGWPVVSCASVDDIRKFLGSMGCWSGDLRSEFFKCRTSYGDVQSLVGRDTAVKACMALGSTVVERMVFYA